jgi:hypothetical protein
MMHIANPMNDAVFRFLLEDTECAETLLSLIIGMKISGLSPNSRNLPVPRLSKTFFTVSFFSYRAHVEDEDGSCASAGIDILKAQHHEDICRFRKHYESDLSANDDLHWTVCVLDSPIEGTESALFGLNEEVIDLLTGEPLDIDEGIIDVLPDRSIIVQALNADQSGSATVEKILSLFHEQYTPDEDTFPEFCTPILQRLAQATASESLQAKIRQQEGVIPHLRTLERNVAEKETAFLRAQQEYDRAVRALAKRLGISVEEARKSLD